MSFSASSARSNSDLRVLDLQFTDDAMIVSPREGPLITGTAHLVYPRMPNSGPASPKAPPEGEA
jgi:hypothetical protein